MAKKRVMRNRKSPHIFFGWSPILARRTDVLEEAILDIETGETRPAFQGEAVEDAEFEEVVTPAPTKKAAEKPKVGRTSRKKPVQKALNLDTLDPPERDLSDLTEGLD